jgi:eukaryotic-like serine/threonine-protein kinase
VTLGAGSKLGPYEILGPIGAGGMGEVYRAKDPRLSREVAIKVLPATFSQDADRLRRFEQEAKAAGVLNHPNITAVYDVGEVDGAPYVVQELLEGETLRSALAGGKLSTRRATEYAMQIAHGLAAAHDKGIVHRDLKPENLFVTKDGRVKILDFGLAKLTQTEGGDSPATNLPTETRGTEPGVVLGTLGYMSPEQVRGRAADARSDIFSFGAILYEMLSGNRAFRGDSAADTMSAILKEDPPDLSVTNQNISPGLERIVRHCLEKNPEQRFHSAHDVAFALEALTGTSAPSVVGAAPVRARRVPWPAIAALAGLAAGAGIAYVAARRAPATAPEAAAGTPFFRRLTNMSGLEEFPTLSPDGQLLAFVHRAGSKSDIWVQRAGSRRPIDVTTECNGESFSPAFSPDGRLVAYGSQCGDGGIFVMGATGEDVRRLTKFGTHPAWSPDGKTIFYSNELIIRPYGRLGTSALWAVDVASGNSRMLYEGDAIQPAVSPHGLRIAYWGLPTGGSQRDIWTLPVKGLAKGERPVPVTQDLPVDWNPIWSTDGRELYFLSNRDGVMNLWRVPIDEATGKTLGPPVADRLPAREVGGMTLSRDGRHLAYVDRQQTFSFDRLTFDAQGRLVGKPEEIYQSALEVADFDVSADGKWIVFDARGAAQEDLYLMSTEGKGVRQVTDDPFKDRHPKFSPDRSRIAFHSDRNGRYEIWTIAPDGSGLTQLTQTQGDTVIEPIWSPDGRMISVNAAKAQLIRLDGAGKIASTEDIPPPAPGQQFYPIDWTADGRRLIGVGVRNEDRFTTTIAYYDPETRQVSTPFPSLNLGRRASRGTALGERIILREDDGLHVIDATGDRRIVENTPSSSYGMVVCRGTTTCYVVRNNENADIWERSMSETAKAPAKP